MKKIILFFAISVFSFALKAQNDSTETNPVSFKVDFYSLYLWRGFQYGDVPSIQPTLEYSFKNLTFGLWGSYAIDASYSEIDIYASYAWKNLTFSVYDYFNPVTEDGPNRFSNYNSETTTHSIDAIVEWEPEQIPVRLQAATLIYGDDRNPETLKNRYSTYFQAGVYHDFKGHEVELYAGFTPHESYYATKANFVSVGLKSKGEISMFKSKIPVSVNFMVNPTNEIAWLAFGVHF